MRLILNDLPIPVELDGADQYLRVAAKLLELDPAEIEVIEITSKSLDARDQEQFYYQLSLVVEVAADYANRQRFPEYQPPRVREGKNARSKERPIVVGFGPAGMFAALELIAAGLRPVILERGRRIEERALDVQRFMRERELDPESNIQFGEGGAGSFSDGKLFSRRNNNTSYASRVLQTFIKFGAPPEIGYMGKPHLGTDVLCRIVGNIREYILERGGEIHYESKMTGLLLAGGEVRGVEVNGREEFLSSTLFLALGHSARETMAILHRQGVAMARRPIAVGVRIEHPAATINLMRYGNKYRDFPGLGAATYSLNYTNRQIKRGVYTFCMCPGGEVVNASSEPGLMVVNGMSYSQRASPFSNAALVVSCHAEDYPGTSPLGGIAFQREIEGRAFAAGGGEWRLPAQNLTDFLAGRGSTELLENSYAQGVVAAELREVFPEFVIAGLMAAFRKWQAEVPLFVSREAILLGAETRTSSPVQILRDEGFQSLTVRNLYPVGEGAGYAGGITSSAADAIKAVECYLLHP